MCPVQIAGAPRGSGISQRVQPVYGVDRLQALTLAFQYVHITLTDATPSVVVTWLGSSDLGLPDMISVVTNTVVPKREQRDGA